MGRIHQTASVASSAVVTVGDAVLVGPHTHLNGTTAEDEVFGAVQEPLDFPGTVYGVTRGTSMREIMRRQCEVFRPRDA